MGGIFGFSADFGNSRILFKELNPLIFVYFLNTQGLL